MFSNPDRVSGLTCAVCTTPSLGAGYRNCFQCNEQERSGSELADIVAPITYAVEGSQAMRDLYNYKDQMVDNRTRFAARDRLLNALFVSLEQHLGCFGGVDAIATVPSSGGRRGGHPVEEMRGMFGEGFEQIQLTYVGPAGLDRQQRRVLDSMHYQVSAGPTRGRRVLLLDDAWVSGVHMQSAAGALKLAGVAFVAAIPIGRVVAPKFEGTRAYLAQHPPIPFDPAICPIDGTRH